MAKEKHYELPENCNINEIVNIVNEDLAMQGYEVSTQIIGPTAAEVIVSCDRKGIKNILGLGLEVRVAITATGNAVKLCITGEWSNKVAAIVVGAIAGWVSCGIFFCSVFTGIVGIINQIFLLKKVNLAFDLAVNSDLQPVPPLAANDYPIPEPYEQIPYSQAPSFTENANEVSAEFEIAEVSIADTETTSEPEVVVSEAYDSTAEQSDQNVEPIVEDVAPNTEAVAETPDTVPAEAIAESETQAD